jgi:hypothetical protein
MHQMNSKVEPILNWYLHPSCPKQSLPQSLCKVVCLLSLFYNDSQDEQQAFEPESSFIFVPEGGKKEGEEEGRTNMKKKKILRHGISIF